MNIALQEAKNYQACAGDCMGSDEAYYAGRTAERTEAEIEAAAKAMYENCATRWHATSSSGKWANAQVHKEYLIKARFALEAARKAVSVDE
ncbi:hypothetical protein [Bifidobacterium crudilactis]|jgi:hypothetical protein|uniref:hypothetical protein n=1 Tax=Bifidobacterium crudilactis TaxID=327277 RepID=UPI002354D25F|nr:hypothetical protein [Bifidobacterium crudilactis]MCI1868272.1 hypothetical protein [Bifidobacterium crudilactis]